MESCSPPTCDLRLALAMALVKARSTQYASLQHWKKKAKARKKELQTLRKMLQQQQCESTVTGILPLPGSCKCSFFQSTEGTFEATLMDVQENDIDQLLFRQFLRNVNRWNYANGYENNLWATGGLDLDRNNQLSVTCKFLAELVRKQIPGAVDGGYLAAYAHQAVEFIQGLLGCILRDQKHNKLAAEGIITELGSQLLEMMLSYSCNNEVKEVNIDTPSWIFQLLSRLGVVCFVGQRILIMASNQFASIAERLCCLDPFEKNVCQVYNNTVFVLQLIEKLVLFHSSCWKKDEYFDERLLEEWVHVFVKLRKTCAVFGNCNSLFLAYLERIAGQMIKQLHRLSSTEGNLENNLNEAILKFALPDRL